MPNPVCWIYHFSPQEPGEEEACREYANKHKLLAPMSPEPRFNLDATEIFCNLIDTAGSLSPGSQIVIYRVPKKVPLVDFVHVVEKLLARGVGVHVVEAGGWSLDTTCPVGLLVFRVTAAFVECARKV